MSRLCLSVKYWDQSVLCFRAGRCVTDCFLIHKKMVNRNSNTILDLVYAHGMPHHNGISHQKMLTQHGKVVTPAKCWPKLEPMPRDKFSTLMCQEILNRLTILNLWSYLEGFNRLWLVLTLSLRFLASPFLCTPFTWAILSRTCKTTFVFLNTLCLIMVPDSGAELLISASNHRVHDMNLHALYHSQATKVIGQFEVQLKDRLMQEQDILVWTTYLRWVVWDINIAISPNNHLSFLPYVWSISLPLSFNCVPFIYSTDTFVSTTKAFHILLLFSKYPNIWEIKIAINHVLIYYKRYNLGIVK